VELVRLFDGEVPKGWDQLVNKVQGMARTIGLPCFMRTGMGSDKHGWKDTCYVTDLNRIPAQIQNLVEWSCLVDLQGLPFDVWVVREFLPLLPAFHAFRGDMPVNRERRYFFDSGKIVSHLAYWPDDAFINHPKPAGWRGMLEEVNRQSAQEVEELTALTLRVARKFKGAWCVDWLWTTRGWYATDMAEAHRAWGCPEALTRKT
jgi:hypothetical protein